MTATATYDRIIKNNEKLKNNIYNLFTLSSKGLNNETFLIS